MIPEKTTTVHLPLTTCMTTSNSTSTPTLTRPCKDSYPTTSLLAGAGTGRVATIPQRKSSSKTSKVREITLLIDV